MRSALAGMPWFLPGIVVSLVLGLVLARPVARSLGIRTPVALLLLVSLGAIIAATLTPAGSRLAGAPASHLVCQLNRFGPGPLSDYLWVTGASLNVALFVPFGIAVGLVPRTRRRWSALVAGAVALPFVIEGLQLHATTLGRDCQTSDLFDNLMGLAIGICLGIAGRRLLRPARPL